MLFVGVVAFVVGLSVGSFLNVLIYRLPRRESIISPPSHCPVCEHKLKPWENIPIISYLLLKGRCSYCRSKISLEYPLIELTTGLLFLILFIKFSVAPGFSASFFVSVLLVAGMIDSEYKIIPNKLVGPAVLVGFLFLLLTVIFKWNFIPLIQTPLLSIPLQSLVGLAIGFGFLFLIAEVSNWYFAKKAKREAEKKEIEEPEGEETEEVTAMGGGDIKLSAFMGLFLGWYIILALLISFLIGALVGFLLILLKRKGRKEPISFGPFLTLGSFITLFYGPQIYHFYRGLWV